MTFSLGLFNVVSASMGVCSSCTLINPRLQYSVYLCVCESVTSLTAMLLTHRYKVRYESNANALLKVTKITLFKSYGVICSPQRTLTISTARRYIRRTTGDYW